MFIASISKSKENVSKYILSQVPLLNLNSLKVLFSHQKIFDVEENLDVGFQPKKLKYVCNCNENIRLLLENYFCNLSFCFVSMLKW